jgi:hypothetical protein
MKLPVISFAALFVFLLTCTDVSLFGDNFSRETYARQYHEKFHVEQGASVDGLVYITKEQQHQDVSLETRVMNHNRTLRASLATPSVSTSTQIIIERAGESFPYVLHGPFLVSKNTAKLHWISPTTLSFNGINTTGTQYEYIVDVRTVSYTTHDFVRDTPSSLILKQSQIVD